LTELQLFNRMWRQHGIQNRIHQRGPVIVQLENRISTLPNRPEIACEVRMIVHEQLQKL
jgi:hypothetical protein